MKKCEHYLAEIKPPTRKRCLEMIKDLSYALPKRLSKTKKEKLIRIMQSQPNGLYMTVNGKIHGIELL